MTLLSGNDEENEEGFPLCPQLEKFRLWGELPPNIEWVAEMLSSRFRYNNEFRAYLEICEDDYEELEDFDAYLGDNEDIRRWKEEGRFSVVLGGEL